MKAYNKGENIGSEVNCQAPSPSRPTPDPGNISPLKRSAGARNMRGDNLAKQNNLYFRVYNNSHAILKVLSVEKCFSESPRGFFVHRRYYIMTASPKTLFGHSRCSIGNVGKTVGKNYSASNQAPAFLDPKMNTIILAFVKSGLSLPEKYVQNQLQATERSL